jgi:hypothetical protein
MADIYTIQQEVKKLFKDNGYTVYDMESFDNQKITRLHGEYPIILIGRGNETIDNDGSPSPSNFIDEECELFINVILESQIAGFEKKCATELKKIKSIVYANRQNQTFCDWYMTENFIAQLQSSNDHSNVYGGCDITTIIKYREAI